MASNQQFSLKWTNYTNHITNAFDSLRSKEDFCDVTLSCEGRKIRAHKVLLSACSSYFKDIFKENPCQHPVIIFRNVKYDDLLSIVVYMYQGEVNIEQESLPTFLHTAEMLSIQGLTDDDDKHHKSDINAPTALTSVAAAAVAAVSAPVAVQQAIPVPVTMHAQTLPKDTRLRSSHTKITMAKHQPISLLSTTTPGEQVLFTAMAAPPVSIVQDSLPAKRKKPNKSDSYSTSPAIADQNADKSTVPEEHPDPDEHVAVEFFKQDTDGELSDYGDEKTYQVDDEPDPELYDSTPQDDEDKDAGDFDKPNIATQAELGRLFSSGGTPDVPAKRPATGTQNTPDTSTSSSSKWSQCQFCKLVITTVNLWRHIRTQHTDQPPLQCEHCQKSFKNKYSKREHIPERAEPSKNSELTCKTCNRVFASLSARRRHEKSKHSEINVQYVCKVCGHRFKTTWSLSTHFSRFHRTQAEMILP